MAKVCVLASDHAEALEDRGITPDCRYHEHVSHREADEMIQLVVCDHARAMLRSGRFLEARGLQLAGMVEGEGDYRTVHSSDGRRRITRVAQIMGYVSKVSSAVYNQVGSAMMVQQAIRAELH